jgi:hypothetical protein
MRKLLIISAVAASIGGPAVADCVTKDHATYCDDGRVSWSSIKIGSVTFSSNGDIARADGNVVSIYNGETGALKGTLTGLGNKIFNSKGALVGEMDGNGSTTWWDGTKTTTR